MRYIWLIIMLVFECTVFGDWSSNSTQQRHDTVWRHRHCEYVQHDSIGICANCSYRELTEVPTDLQKNITCLNLVGNNIAHLDGKIWQNYKCLKKLSLARNSITSVNNDDFKNMAALEMLDLSLNRIRYYRISDGAFKPLILLTYLDIKQNFTSIFKNETYPISLRYLGQLRTLMIDGLNCSIPKLPNLTSLYFSGLYGRCSFPILSRSIFVNVKYIESLYLTNCSIETMEMGISEVWPNIVELDFSWNTKLGFSNITIGMQGSNLTRLRKLNLNSVYSYYKFDMCSSYTKDDMAYMTNSPMEVFTVESNNLVRIAKEAVPVWPKTLKYLSVRDNMLMYGQYVDDIYQKNTFQNLLYYDTSQMFLSHTPKDFVHNDTDSMPKTRTSYIPQGGHIAANDIGTTMFTRFHFKDYFQILDDRLRKFNITREGDQTIMEDSNKIEYIDLSDNMPGTIEVTLKLFEKSPFVKVLNISNNYLGYQLLDDNNIFSKYSSLRVLDLSRNGIIRLLSGVFEHQIHLQQLYLSYNKITNLSFVNDCLKHGTLKYLDVSSNHLQMIPKDVRSLMSTLTNFTIDISDNNFRCSCDNLEFVSWVKSNDITISNIDETSCKFDNGSTVTFKKLDYDNLHGECLPPTFNTLILVVSLCILSFLIIVSCGLIYRFKWNLRYLYYMAKFKLINGGYQPIDDREFEKDIFVSYAEEDGLFVRQQVIRELEDVGAFSLLVHERDFMPGEFVVDNIVKAVASTRKTLVILTENYIRRKWCMYEMNMARMEAADTGRNVLCVILKEDIQTKFLPLEITEVLKRKTYLEYPTDQQHMAGFWERLRATLHHDT